MLYEEKRQYASFFYYLHGRFNNNICYSLEIDTINWNAPSKIFARKNNNIKSDYKKNHCFDNV